jgi:tetratricopeptide (TPR) repeat protein
MMAVLATIGLSVLALANPAPGEVDQRLAPFEQQLAVDPENLRIGALYRQHAIALREYDRAIKFLDRLASRPSAGPNVYLTLALAYVDKVPDASTIRQVYLGRDAINALTKSLDRKRDDIPLYIRGLINLYYDAFIYHRTDKGVADLEEASRLAASHPTAVWVPRIYVSLGDGYWRLGQRARARVVWRDALGRFPDWSPLAHRVRSSDSQVADIVERALDPNVRVDTSLRELFPDIQPVPAASRR